MAGGVREGACPGHNTVYHSRSFVRVDFVALFGLRNFLPDQAFPDHIAIEAEGHAGRTQRIARVSRWLRNGQRSLGPAVHPKR